MSTWPKNIDGRGIIAQLDVHVAEPAGQLRVLRRETNGLRQDIARFLPLLLIHIDLAAHLERFGRRRRACVGEIQFGERIVITIEIEKRGSAIEVRGAVSGIEFQIFSQRVARGLVLFLRQQCIRKAQARGRGIARAPRPPPGNALPPPAASPVRSSTRPSAK